MMRFAFLCGLYCGELETFKRGIEMGGLKYFEIRMRKLFF